jgi:D-arabinose 1-dehydrogenase-like Zn-dependent alcohol dehydrogenase
MGRGRHVHAAGTAGGGYSLCVGGSLHTTVKTFPLGRANEALARLRDGQLRGAAVLVMDSGCL